MERAVYTAPSERVYQASFLAREAGESLRGIVGIGAAVAELKLAGDCIFIEGNSLLRLWR